MLIDALIYRSTFDRDGKAAMASLPGPDVEVGWLTLDAPFQAWTSGVNPVSSAILEWPDGELERRSRDVDVLVHDADGVDAQLVWHEVHGVQPILDFGHDGLLNLIKMEWISIFRFFLHLNHLQL